MSPVEVQKSGCGWDFYLRGGDTCFPRVDLSYIQNVCFGSFSIKFGCCRLGGISIAESYAPQRIQHFGQWLTLCRSNLTARLFNNG